ncbi:MAG: TlpA family protein disulfide reductase [Sphingobacteriales bacterium]|nr:MAG: TlpA family protein disulfide reductase [Sphingobacteriales bacterium]
MKQLFALAALVLVSFGVKAQSVPSYTANDLNKRISNPDTMYVVNFWATWCAPCVKELPEFTAIENASTGKPVKVLLVSLDFKEDYPGKLVSFIKKKKLEHEVIWLNETNANVFIPKIENSWQGSIPATLMVYPKNEYRNFFEGTIKASRLQMLIDKQLAL